MTTFIHANTAAVGRKYPAAAQRMIELTSELASPGFYTSIYPRLGAELEQVRNLAAALLGVAPSTLALTPSTSDGIAAFLAAFPFQPGDVVALGRGSFISVPAALVRVRQMGVMVTHIGTEQGCVTAKDLANTPEKTRLVIIDWVNYWSGTRNDMQPLVDFCRRANLPLLIDAVQGLGAVPIEFDLSEVAALACGGHKWLRGPEGTGFLYVAPWMLPRLTPRHLGYRSLATPTLFEADQLELSTDTRVFEVGTLNTVGLAGLGAALAELAAAGSYANGQRIAQTTSEIHQYLSSVSAVKVVTPADPAQRAGIVSFCHQAAPTEDVFKRLREAGINVGMRRGHIRVSADADTPAQPIIAGLEHVLRAR